MPVGFSQSVQPSAFSRTRSGHQARAAGQAIPPHPTAHSPGQVAAGLTHVLAVTEGGQLFAWGEGKKGQLGLGSTSSAPTPFAVTAVLKEQGVSHVACGHQYSLCVTLSDRVLAWGANEQGQLGLGDLTHRSAPCVVPALDGKGTCARPTPATPTHLPLRYTRPQRRRGPLRRGLLQ